MVREGIGHAVPLKTSHLGLLKAMPSDMNPLSLCADPRCDRSREFEPGCEWIANCCKDCFITDGGTHSAVCDQRAKREGRLDQGPAASARRRLVAVAKAPPAGMTYPAIALPAMGATPVIRGRPPENDLERMHVEGGGELGVRVVDLQENVYERSRFIRKDVLELLKHVQCKVNETLCDNLPKLQVPPTPQGQETVARMITSAADWTTTSVCFVMYILDFECS